MKCRHSKTFVIYIVFSINKAFTLHISVLFCIANFSSVWQKCKFSFLLSDKIRYMTFIQQMDLKLKSLVLAFICVVVIGYGDAAQQNSNNFLSSYNVQESICQKMGWEPKCSKKPITGLLLFYYFFVFAMTIAMSFN